MLVRVFRIAGAPSIRRRIPSMSRCARWCARCARRWSFPRCVMPLLLRTSVTPTPFASCTTRCRRSTSTSSSRHVDTHALSSGVRGLAIRIARNVNQLLFRRGKFWADRWHAHALTTPRTVRHGLVYVLTNFRKHEPTNEAVVDPYSSAPYFEHFAELPSAPIRCAPELVPRVLAGHGDEPSIANPRTWLLR